MRLRWTLPAAEDLYRIVQHIQKDNPAVATDVAKLCTMAAARLHNSRVAGVKAAFRTPARSCSRTCPILSFTRFTTKLWKSCAFITVPKIGLKFDGGDSHESCTIFASTHTFVHDVVVRRRPIPTPTESHAHAFRRATGLRTIAD